MLLYATINIIGYRLAMQMASYVIAYLLKKQRTRYQQLLAVVWQVR